MRASRWSRPARSACFAAPLLIGLGSFNAADATELAFRYAFDTSC